MKEEERICGAETIEGEPCRNPPGDNGRCWIPAHNDEDDEDNPQGRPSKFTEDRKEAILNAARNGTTVEGCARAAGIGERTLYDWLDEFPQFSQAFNRARAEGEQHLVKMVAAEDPEFILERSYDYVKTERREIEADVEQTTTHELAEEERQLAVETLRQLQARSSDE